jgi:hypothetical protein
MTTYSIVGVYDDEQCSTWHAVSVGGDGYPSGVGFSLYWNYRRVFKADLAALVKRVIDDRPEGWYSIAGANLLFPALVWSTDYLKVMDTRQEFEEAARHFQLSDPVVSRSCQFAARQIDQLPVACDKHGAQSFITQDTPEVAYWAEWSYLFDPAHRLLHIFWGDPASPITEAICLDDHLPMPFWDNLWNALPERETRLPES